MTKIENEKFEKSEIVQIAKWQRVFIYLFLGMILVSILGRIIPIPKNWVSVAIVAPLLIARIIMGISAIIVIYRLAKALRKKAPFLYAFPGMIIPLVNLLVIVSLLAQATKVLKAQGLKVGLLGCKLSELS